MPSFFRTSLYSSKGSVASNSLQGASQFLFCSGKCQSDKPPEGGVELAPGKWRCSACWIELARKRQPQ